MKSATGNNTQGIIPPDKGRELYINRRSMQGFTFTEVMISLVVLCCGIVLIYKSFFLCADYLNNLTCRLYASSLIDEKITDIAKSFADWPVRDLDFGNNTVTLDINYKPVRFTYDINLAPLADVKSVWQLDVKLSWADGPRSMHAKRSAYMIR
ncbi:MAG: prepilin-type N-terminal cleavage/methylation domain-containing protein [Candidatus Omnitrophica bacterium]|nr:prepilin-type N-terminal cleavage/methylation domain-containing protein [Candidatus Omnitrophota bacterium]